MNNITTEKIYNVDNVFEVLYSFHNEKKLWKSDKKGIQYYNVSCAFDIETSSFYRKGNKTYSYDEMMNAPKGTIFEKIGLMYIWQLGINGFCFVGRTFSELKMLLNKVAIFLNLGAKRKVIIYVHNLSFEFQFIAKELDIHTVFATDLRKVLKCENEYFIFKCSYYLSGYSLETVAQHLQYPIKKLVGFLDYQKIRHTTTPLNNDEMQYCINDIKILMLYINEEIKTYKNILNIPLTKTGKVRKFCKTNCFNIKTDKYKGKNYQYINTIRGLCINNLHELKMLQRAFCGGFTHANAYYVNDILHNVASFDFTSSYPAVMVSEMYPLSTAKQVVIRSEEEFLKYKERYLMIFDIEYLNIYSISSDDYLSISKCFVLENFSENNGRLTAAARIVTTITNVDFDIIKRCYKYTNYKIGNCYIYKKGYLPTPFVKCILQLYKDKTILKGVKGKEKEYLNSKEMLNSCYGMCVTNPLNDNFLYDNIEGWSVSELTIEEKKKAITEYNINDNRYLFYPWGVFVTAYARKNLWHAINYLRNDYIYSDTDSVKFLNYEKHKGFFYLYNKYLEKKLIKACNFHKISTECIHPCTEKGTTKLLGAWDFEGVYEKFKTLGAKRYMYTKNNVNNLVVSGLNKDTAIKYLEKNFDNIYNIFDNYLYIPSTGCGKNILTYNDNGTSGYVTDYLGVTEKFSVKSFVHMEPTDYTLNVTANFIEHILNIKKRFKK